MLQKRLYSRCFAWSYSKCKYRWEWWSEHSLCDGLPNPNARLLIADVLPVTHATMKPDILTMSKRNTGTLHIRNALIKKRNDEWFRQDWRNICAPILWKATRKVGFTTNIWRRFAERSSAWQWQLYFCFEKWLWLALRGKCIMRRDVFIIVCPTSSYVLYNFFCFSVMHHGTRQ